MIGSATIDDNDDNPLNVFFLRILRSALGVLQRLAINYVSEVESGSI